jgi:ferritin-like metal-binding protein YciE
MKGIKDLLIEELYDIYSAEEQIVEALPKMVAASESPDLKKAFQSHLKETKGQVQRLKKIFKILKVEKKEKLCKAAKGLIQECKEVLKNSKTKSAIRDAALISKAQRIEHYEIAAYGTVRTFAKEIDLDTIVDLLQQTLDEEGNADKKLTEIAEGGLLKTGINQQANMPNEKSTKTNRSKTSTRTNKKSTSSKKLAAAR